MACPLAHRISLDQAHAHKPCACLDLHLWAPLGADDQVCTRCGARRCSHVRVAGGTKQRCNRRDQRHAQHLYPQQPR